LLISLVSALHVRVVAEDTVAVEEAEEAEDSVAVVQKVVEAEVASQVAEDANLAVVRQTV
jgi:hypothetical protein